MTFLKKIFVGVGGGGCCFFFSVHDIQFPESSIFYTKFSVQNLYLFEVFFYIACFPFIFYSLSVMSEKNVCPNQDLNHQKKIFNFIHYFILHVTSLFEITIFLKHEFFQIRGFHFFTKDLNNNAKKNI